MTDMRATERLLEVIEEFLNRPGRPQFDDADIEGQRAEIDAYNAITELRRRGDTLVRRDDLRAFIEAEHDDESTYCRTEAEHATINAARARLENALGGKMR